MWCSKLKQDRKKYTPACKLNSLEILLASQYTRQLYLAQHGREGKLELTMASYIIHRDDDGVEYVSLMHNPQTKHHKDLDTPTQSKPSSFIFLMVFTSYVYLNKRFIR